MTPKLSRALMLLVLAGVWFLQSACSAAKKPSSLETALANMAKDVIIPIEAEQLQNPLAPTEQVIQEGHQVYQQFCVLCHDSDGQAQTALGQSMYPPAMDLTSPHVQAWSDAELFWIIQNGIRMTGMPAWNTDISEEDTWKLVHYIRSFSCLSAPSDKVPTAPVMTASTVVPEKTPAGQASGVKAGENVDGDAGKKVGKSTRDDKSDAALFKAGKALYRQEGCFICHQLDGEGGKVGPNLSEEGSRGRTDEWLIGHFKAPREFTKDSVMPSFKNLTDNQLYALVEFLQQQGGTGQHSHKPRKTSAAAAAVIPASE